MLCIIFLVVVAGLVTLLIGGTEMFFPRVGILIVLALVFVGMMLIATVGETFCGVTADTGSTTLIAAGLCILIGIRGGFAKLSRSWHGE